MRISPFSSPTSCKWDYLSLSFTPHIAQPVYILRLSCTFVELKASLCKISNPITELVVMRRDEESLLAVKGVADAKCRATSATIFREVRGIRHSAGRENPSMTLYLTPSHL